MAFLLIAAAVAAMILLYATDRILKALARVRRYRVMSERLDAVAVRSEVQQEQRKTAAAASTALTSVMPAISRPPLTLPGLTKPPRRGTPSCPAHGGDRQAHGGDRQAHGGDRQAHGGEATARPRPRAAERPSRPGHATGPRQPQQH
jgi:hypothetical protein